jgi:sprouty-related EVH1 domain-containing protein
VAVRKRKLSASECEEDCQHEYLILGKRMSDQLVVLSCTIKRDFEYNKVK